MGPRDFQAECPAKDGERGPAEAERRPGPGRVLGEADATVPHAVASAGEALADAIDGIAARLRHGGRLVYVGAGTSGRLAHVDAVECQSTFGVEPDRVVALVAGGADRSYDATNEAEIWDLATGAFSPTGSMGASRVDAIATLLDDGRVLVAGGVDQEGDARGTSGPPVLSAEVFELVP